MKQSDCYEIGYITKTHGLKGEVTLELDVDEPESYSELDAALVEVKKQLVPYIVERISIHQKRAIIKFEGVNKIEDAQKLVHCKVMLALEDLPDAEEGRFYLHDIIGYTVEDNVLGKLGIITQLYEGSYQDILGMEYQGKEVLIPVVDAIVLSADAETKTVQTNLPDGLVDLYLEDENKGIEEEKL